MGQRRDERERYVNRGGGGRERRGGVGMESAEDKGEEKGNRG